MEHLVTPTYDHSKLENPSITDLIDVFEDLWRGYVFVPASLLLNTQNGDVAAMTVVSSYFEVIWIYLTGEDSNGRSKQFFVNGFSRCFSADTPGIEIAANAIYKHVRCGLAHTAMLSHKVNFTRVCGKAFYLTYPKNPDGSLDMKAPVASIVVNPVRMYEGVLRHFEQYLKDLRRCDCSDLIESFQNAVAILWGLGKGENIIGMTEDEFKAYE